MQNNNNNYLCSFRYSITLDSNKNAYFPFDFLKIVKKRLFGKCKIYNRYLKIYT